VDGKFFEVTLDGTTVWQYSNPYPGPNMNAVFKIVYIPPAQPPEPNIPDLDCNGDLSWTNVKPNTTVNGIIQLQNIGDIGSLLNWTINTSLLSWGTWTVIPECGTGLKPEDGPVTIQISVIAPDQPNTNFEGYLRIENTNNTDTDFCNIPVYLTTPKNTAIEFFWIFFNQFFERFPHAFPLIHHIFFP
jgi:hypothetical protein